MKVYRCKNGGYGHQEKARILMRGKGNFNRGGRGGGGGQGGNRGRGGGNRQGNYRRNDDDANVQTQECGIFDYLCNGSAVFKLCSADKVVPLTQTFLYDSNNNKIGKIKDVFGPMDNVYFEMEPNEGVLQNMKAGTKVYAPVNRLHPQSFYTDEQQPKRGGGRGGGRGGRGGGGRGGRGGGGGGRGGFRGGRGRGR